MDLDLQNLLQHIVLLNKKVEATLTGEVQELTPQEVLTKAAEYLEANPSHFLQGKYTDTCGGFCTLGVTRMIEDKNLLLYPRGSKKSDPSYTTTRLIKKALLQIDPDYDEIHKYNDSHTREEAVQLLRKAASLSL